MTDSAFLAEMATRYGTPAYVYDLASVRGAARALRTDLPPATRLLYSVKANPHPLVIRALHGEGLDAEVSSVGEVTAAIDAGCRPAQLVHSGPGKSLRDLEFSLEVGVRTFSIESVTDHARLVEIAARTRVDCDYVVRLNGPSGSSLGSLRMTGKPTAFGVDTTEIGALSRLFRPTGRVRPVGTHTFSATNVGSEEALLAEFAQSLRTVSEICERTHFMPQIINLGGGFPAPNAGPGLLPRHPGLAEGLGQLLDRYMPGCRDENAKLAFESGRYLVSTSGTLLTQVLDVKRSKGRVFIVLDAGVNALGGMSGIGRLMTPSVCPYLLDGDPADDLGTEEFATLVGPLCTPLDVLSREAPLAAARPGQIIAVPNVGAYGLTASLLGFLSHPVPVEIVHDAGQVISARRLSLNSVEVPPRNHAHASEELDMKETTR